jgi:hypothetical protein
MHFICTVFATRTSCGTRPPFLPNGSARDRPLSQFLNTQQHSQHTFELADEMDLIASEPLPRRLAHTVAHRSAATCLSASLEGRGHAWIAAETLSTDRYRNRRFSLRFFLIAAIYKLIA